MTLKNLPSGETPCSPTPLARAPMQVRKTGYTGVLYKCVLRYDAWPVNWHWNSNVLHYANRNCFTVRVSRPPRGQVPRTKMGFLDAKLAQLGRLICVGKLPLSAFLIDTPRKICIFITFIPVSREAVGVGREKKNRRSKVKAFFVLHIC